MCVYVTYKNGIMLYLYVSTIFKVSFDKFTTTKYPNNLQHFIFIQDEPPAPVVEPVKEVK